MQGSLHGKRVVLYARYSSQMQRESSIDDQVRLCRNYVERLEGVVKPELVLSDYATSGASLLRLAESKQIDVIVTEDLSRISRDLSDSAHLFRRLRYLGIQLIGVSDGIDTDAKHAKVTYTIKSLVSDLYLEDLRDKTLRGLEGRALAGYSTGGLPYGYHSDPELDAYGRVIGHRVQINEEQAAVVRRIFELYLAGHSLDTLARLLTGEHIPPPRAKTRHRRKGWIASTIRAFLHNVTYTGISTFKARKWQKVPGTNSRRYKKRDESEIIRKEYPDRRIVDEATWDAVQSRLRAVRACYSKKLDGSPKGRAFSGRTTSYPFSGILRCGECGAPMSIYGGTNIHRYYRCGDFKKRGTCKNALPIREDVIRGMLIEHVRDQLKNPDALAHLYAAIGKQLGELSTTANAELKEHRERLARVEDRIQGICNAIADGDRSTSLRTMLHDLEAQAKAEKNTIKGIQQRGAEIRLPTPEEVASKVLDLEKTIAQDPTGAREKLRRMFRDGQVNLVPQSDGTYAAEGILLPVVLLLAGSTMSSPDTREKHVAPAQGCAGRI
jgi:site-specific DNA recombinase